MHTTESGTGLVHTAPGHGQDDYLTGLKYNLPLLHCTATEVDEVFKGEKKDHLNKCSRFKVEIVATKNGEETTHKLLFAAKTAEERAAWIEAIDKAHLAAEKKAKVVH